MDTIQGFMFKQSGVFLASAIIIYREPNGTIWHAQVRSQQYTKGDVVAYIVATIPVGSEMRFKVNVVWGRDKTAHETFEQGYDWHWSYGMAGGHSKTEIMACYRITGTTLFNTLHFDGLKTYDEALKHFNVNAPYRG